ncbi:hypothetical protein PLESTB_000724300 [Pleodorina starrii]|uniref:3-oxo-5-alpha-steroid 4-dehydrogenase C-terminal domain-containing protein n=1 Tax=Pleodorina starrii TaxID=330485 RepID=A0A9W6F1U0_9CHLO|nr:hypothetical protein PLESTM_001702800 [Pleodorina starrii]GLC53247.1 hypothetical protein PLESTB_000724300 [Pleodorina starrii]GLC68118.1 hypothetical protein PLESTF_000647900 [Pleodorina starrii]
MQMSFPHCDVRDLEGLLWTHVALLSLCAILILASFNAQFKDAAPYGRHADPEKARAWGFPVPQRAAHMVSDGVAGILVLLAVYLLYAGLLPTGGRFSEVRAINVVLLAGWLLHYLYRGIVHPLIMPYSSKTVAIGITLAGLFPNLLFSYLIAAQLACTVYPEDWASQPRFIIGVVLYGIGTVINRWADLKVRAGRLALRRRGRGEAAAGAAASLPQGAGGAGDVSSSTSAARQGLLDAAKRDGDGDGDGETEGEAAGGGGGGGSGKAAGGGRSAAHGSQAVRQEYFIPHGGLYELVSCPNYLGELIEWSGYALALWSWPALAWALFGASTFIPRSLTNHRWYKQQFGAEYPANRRALIPFIL